MSDLSVSLPVSLPAIRSHGGRLSLGLSGHVGRFLLGMGGLGILLAVWWLFTGPLAGAGSFSRRFAPGLALTSLIEMGWHGDLLTHVWLSLKRVLVGLAVALAVGVPLGLAVGGLRVVEAATSPVFQFLRMISPLSWMPVAVMVLGVGDAPIYFLLSFAAVWPILLSTADGVKQLDRRWLLLAQSLAATRWETLTRIVLPGVLAPILTGVRLAIGILWIVLVPAEMLGVAGGLGYLVLDTRDRMAYGELTAVVLVIGLLGFLLDAIARLLYRMRAHG
ncbi:ABC transporter permease [Granulibacter bethesdensis]|uniref:ABC transporter permease n=1 Tax=Granulibacter bethesdensis TaxID=364410 RepID=UPI0003F1CBEC|nr:ABC transporter permease [Granulibacter bethesdensis]AHJ65209.1 ABC transporter permease protein [Granulibacter bethesdensis CGDNIH4]APH60647.1 ABC transporter permease protein [Granulibacter bethesdensis]